MYAYKGIINIIKLVQNMERLHYVKNSRTKNNLGKGGKKINKKKKNISKQNEKCNI